MAARPLLKACGRRSSFLSAVDSLRDSLGAAHLSSHVDSSKSGAKSVSSSPSSHASSPPSSLRSSVQGKRPALSNDNDVTVTDSDEDLGRLTNTGRTGSVSSLLVCVCFNCIYLTYIYCFR